MEAGQQRDGVVWPTTKGQGPRTAPEGSSMEKARISVFDTTLRDGEQSPGCSMNVQEKLRLAHQLDRLGVDVIEAGFPIASDGDFAAVQATAAAIRPPIIAGLA